MKNWHIYGGENFRPATGFSSWGELDGIQKKQNNSCTVVSVSTLKAVKPVMQKPLHAMVQQRTS
jgi:hypothetical protein